MKHCCYNHYCWFEFLCVSVIIIIFIMLLNVLLPVYVSLHRSWFICISIYLFIYLLKVGDWRHSGSNIFLFYNVPAINKIVLLLHFSFCFIWLPKTDGVTAIWVSHGNSLTLTFDLRSFLSPFISPHTANYMIMSQYNTHIAHWPWYSSR